MEGFPLKQQYYTEQELLQDGSFERWVLGTASVKEIRKWNHWVGERERNRELAGRAARSLLGFTFAAPGLPDVDKKWEQVRQRITEIERHKLPLEQRLSIRYNWVYAAAAAVLLAIMVGVGYYLEDWGNQQETEQIAEVRQETITTGAGEQKKIILSDGSSIILKSNSSLTYFDGWVADKKVQVRLKGEAYFSIAHRSSSDRPELQVITPQGIIHDLGTQFVVFTRPDRTTVVLEEGSVSVEPGRKYGPNQKDRIRMVPGEFVELQGNGIVVKKNVNASLYTAWATGVLQFNYTPVHEFARRLEGMYGIKVIVTPALTDEKINGAVYYRTMTDLVKSVSKVLKAPVYRSASGDTIYIGQMIKK